MDHSRCHGVIAFILFFTAVTGLESDIAVENANCCSAVRVSRAMGVYEARCPTQALQMACGPEGCCVATNQTVEMTVAESYRPYACANSNYFIEPWNVCNGYPDCPYGDDELYCAFYTCAESLFDVTSSSSFEAPCPSSDRCYSPTDSCLSSELCPNETASVDLCVDPCPSSCLCDVLAVVCFGSIEQDTTGDRLLDPNLLQFALVDLTSSLVISNSTRSSSNGSTVILNPADIIQANTIYLSAPNPMSGPITSRFDVQIEDGAFRNNTFLATLVLRRSTLEVINTTMFEGLSSLEYLNLDNNRIRSIEAGSFDSLTDLKTLSLQDNRLTILNSGIFDGLQDLRSLNLDVNDIAVIEEGAFYQLIQLRVLFLTTTEIVDFPVEIFEGLEGLPAIHVSDFRLCCRIVNVGQCVDYEPVRFASCSGLLEYQALGIAMWILGGCAFFGNALVLMMRVRARRNQKRARKTAQIQSILILNLATADLLTGLYMVTLAAADTAFGTEYFAYADWWRDGLPCKIIGVLAVLSGEASVLILALISIDRLLVVVFPFGPIHLSLLTVKIWTAVIWIFSTIIAILPPIVTSVLPEEAWDRFYIYSDVCLGLPLVRSTNVEIDVQQYDYETQDIEYTYVYTADGNYAYYAIITFIGINLLCFLTILVSYVAIFIYARRTARRARRSAEREQELRLAARMALIVGTDFCCWMPIIILGILVQTGAVTVSTEMYAWCVVFIIPINSAVNPFLYTFANTCTGKSGVHSSSSTPIVSKSDDSNSKGTKLSNL